MPCHRPRQHSTSFIEHTLFLSLSLSILTPSNPSERPISKSTIRPHHSLFAHRTTTSAHTTTFSNSYALLAAYRPDSQRSLLLATCSHIVEDRFGLDMAGIFQVRSSFQFLVCPDPIIDINSRTLHDRRPPYLHPHHLQGHSSLVQALVRHLHQSASQVS